MKIFLYFSKDEKNQNKFFIYIELNAWGIIIREKFLLYFTSYIKNLPPKKVLKSVFFDAVYIIKID